MCISAMQNAISLVEFLLILIETTTDAESSMTLLDRASFQLQSKCISIFYHYFKYVHYFGYLIYFKTDFTSWPRIKLALLVDSQMCWIWHWTSSGDEAPVLEPWKVWWKLSLPLLPGPLWPVSITSMSKIDLFTNYLY